MILDTDMGVARGSRRPWPSLDFKIFSKRLSNF